jgi:hypothetical protein
MAEVKSLHMKVLWISTECHATLVDLKRVLWKFGGFQQGVMRDGGFQPTVFVWWNLNFFHEGLFDFSRMLCQFAGFQPVL